MTQTIRKAKKSQQIDYWKVVKVDHEKNEIIMLDYVFKHSPDFKGAVGTLFEPISQKEYQERLKEENLIDSLIDSGIELPNDYKREGGFVAMIKEMTHQDKESLMFDTSYREHWDKLREHGYPESDYPIFNCAGGGRCFDKKFKGNVNTELSKLIREYES